MAETKHFKEKMQTANFSTGDLLLAMRSASNIYFCILEHLYNWARTLKLNLTQFLEKIYLFIYLFYLMCMGIYFACMHRLFYVYGHLFCLHAQIYVLHACLECDGSAGTGVREL